MSPEALKHRLAAILAADVVGYSRLMSDDEPATVAALDRARAIFRKSITANQGRVIDMAGDSVLAVFETAAGAVASALDIQESLNAATADESESRRMLFRIGVHVGDLFEKADGTVYGDGVNIAARLESLAKPGTVAVSDMVYGAVRDKTNVHFEDAGEHRVKNITHPVRVYYARRDDGQATKRPRRTKRKMPIDVTLVAAALGIILAIGVGAWYWPAKNDVEPASLSKMAFELPEKPSVVVLPFKNLADGNTHEYFSDGITEDITTDLSKLSGLFVVARNSAFSYKGTSTKINEIAEQLGVRYVLAGSVRRASEEVRINTQLVDALTGGQIWAERFDGPIADIFALQDKITSAVVKQLRVVLVKGEVEKARASNGTTVPEAYEAYLIGAAHQQSKSFESMARAKSALEKAVELDPNYASAWGRLATLYVVAGIRKYVARLGFKDGRGQELLDKALVQPTVHAYRAQLIWMHFKGKHKEMPAILDRLDALDPNYWVTRIWRGNLALRKGDTASALAHYQDAQRLDPHNPLTAARIGRVHIQDGRFSEAIEILEKSYSIDTGNERLLSELTALYAVVGEIDKAKQLAAKLHTIRQSDGSRTALSGMYFRSYYQPEMVKRLRAGLNLAGIPAAITAAELGLSPEQQVTGNKLEKLTNSVRRTGAKANGKWVMDYFADGTGVRYQLGVATARFNWTIDSDTVTETFQHPSKRKPNHCTFYNQLGGGKASLDEYLAVCTESVRAFSTVPIPTESN